MNRPGQPSAKPKAMISSITKGFELYRQKVREACVSAGFEPVMMEYLSSSDVSPVAVSLGLVEQADVYLGFFPHHYGYTPPGEQRSMTHLEYEHAVKICRPRLIFLMDPVHPFPPCYVDKGEEAAKLEALKEQLKEELVVAFFSTPEDLYGKVLNALTTRRPDLSLAQDRDTDNSSLTDTPAVRTLRPKSAVNSPSRRKWQAAFLLSLIVLLLVALVSREITLRSWQGEKETRIKKVAERLDERMQCWREGLSELVRAAEKRGAVLADRDFPPLDDLLDELYSLMPLEKREPIHQAIASATQLQNLRHQTQRSLQPIRGISAGAYNPEEGLRRRDLDRMQELLDAVSRKIRPLLVNEVR
jgi:hypothetical protein